MFVSAGDLIGATPLVSALFHDEPSIEAFNAMGLDYNGVGNHEFDEGVTELLRMRYGGCHPVDGCQDGDPFGGSTFEFLAANVAYKDTGETIFPPYAIHHFQGVKVAIVGMTLEGTPVDRFSCRHLARGLLRRGRQRQRSRADAEAAERRDDHRPAPRGRVDARTAESDETINSCVSPTGALPPIVERMDDEIDVVVTGHTNWAVNCMMDGKIVTGAASFGRLITDIDLTVSRATKDVVSATVNNTIVTRTVPRAADMTALLAKYVTLSAPFANRVIGRITANITRAANAAGESALGDVIADAQKYDAQQAGTGSQIAFMNAGGIRADLNFASSPVGEGDGNVTYGEAFTVQPFGNSLVTMSLSGAQIDALLERQFTGGIGILQVSDGFAYTVQRIRPGQREGGRDHPQRHADQPHAPVPGHRQQLPR